MPPSRYIPPAKQTKSTESRRATDCWILNVPTTIRLWGNKLIISSRSSSKNEPTSHSFIHSTHRHYHGRLFSTTTIVKNRCDSVNHNNRRKKNGSSNSSTMISNSSTDYPAIWWLIMIITVATVCWRCNYFRYSQIYEWSSLDGRAQCDPPSLRKNKNILLLTQNHKNLNQNYLLKLHNKNFTETFLIHPLLTKDDDWRNYNSAPPKIHRHRRM